MFHFGQFFVFSAGGFLRVLFHTRPIFEPPPLRRAAPSPKVVMYLLDTPRINQRDAKRVGPVERAFKTTINLGEGVQFNN